MINNSMSNIIRFFEDFDYMQPDCIIAYLAGMTLEVEDEVVEQVLEAGVGELVEDDDDNDFHNDEASDVE